MNEISQVIKQAIWEELHYVFPEDTRFRKSNVFQVERENGKITVSYTKNYEIVRAALLVKAKDEAEEGDFTEREIPYLDDACFMADCSKNTVNNLPTVKKLIRNLAALGYNALMLYTEDTYEVENEPCFGYMRGRYTGAEIKEIDEYARAFDIELIPCIQTLAHLNQIVRFKEYETHFDCEDILLVGDERVYELIENIFKTLAKNFTSRRAHVGMDEAGLLGRGRYIDKNGYRERFDVLLEHLNRVAEIAKKYGFSCMIWSDMFWKIAEEIHSEFDELGRTAIPQEVKDKIPPTVSLVHWEYDFEDEATYKHRFAMHRGMKSPVWHAGASCKCLGFVPFNERSEKRFDLAFDEMKENGITHGMNCTWGDDGGECALFATLPSMAYYGYKNRNKGKAEVCHDFHALTGYDYEDFIAMDYPNTMCGKYIVDFCNPTKISLYNDIFCPQFDLDLYYEEDIPDLKKARRILKGIEKKYEGGQYAVLFKVIVALLDVCILKYDLGVCLRKSYKADDRERLRLLVGRVRKTERAVKRFLEVLRERWFIENKPFGFDIQEYRLGGLYERLQSCANRLDDYLNGKIAEIPELKEEPIYEMFSGRISPTRLHYNSFILTASVNRF